MEPIQVEAKFKPNYKDSCICCGQTPTVDVYVLDKLAESTGMCGVCTWGEADCIDPEEW